MGCQILLMLSSGTKDHKPTGNYAMTESKCVPSTRNPVCGTDWVLGKCLLNKLIQHLCVAFNTTHLKKLIVSVKHDKAKHNKPGYTCK